MLLQYWVTPPELLYELNYECYVTASLIIYSIFLCFSPFPLSYSFEFFICCSLYFVHHYELLFLWAVVGLPGSVGVCVYLLARAWRGVGESDATACFVPQLRCSALTDQTCISCSLSWLYCFVGVLCTIWPRCDTGDLALYSCMWLWCTVQYYSMGERQREIERERARVAGRGSDGYYFGGHVADTTECPYYNYSILSSIS